MHRRGDLIGLVFLAVDPGAGLLGHRGQLFSGAGDLGHAVADAADQLPQLAGHAGNGVLHLTQFITALRGVILRQVACGHGLHDAQGVLQRVDDLAGNQPGRQCAQHQCQRGAQGQRGLGLLRIAVAFLGLQVSQLMADVHQAVAQGFEGALLLIAEHLRVAKLHKGIAVARECFFDVLQREGVFSGQGGRQAGELGLRLVDRVQRRLRGIRRAAVGVTAHVKARILHGARQLLDPVEHAQVIAFEHILLNGFDAGDSAVCTGAQLRSAQFAGLGGFIDLAEDGCVLRDGL